jgi:hypothetical protein
MMLHPRNPHPNPLPWKGRGEKPANRGRMAVSSPRLRGEDQGEGLRSIQQ